MSKWVATLVLIAWSLVASAGNTVWHHRRQLAAEKFRDGIFLCHSSSLLEAAADGFHQDPLFYYFTGLENTTEAILAIDGKAGESWLFLPSHGPFSESGLQPQVATASTISSDARGMDAKEREAFAKLGIEHVVEWSELETFFVSRLDQPPRIYYVSDYFAVPELPASLLSKSAPQAATWLQVLSLKWPQLEMKEASSQVHALLEVQDPDEIEALRSAARTTVTALFAGMRGIHPGASQRSVEAIVENSCWTSGAHGTSFWPWAMAGENAVFPHPFFSLARYDHLDRTMHAGELVRLDIGCEWSHYQGDLGRTLPVSGHYDDAQRETWTIFVAAYRAGVRALHAGVTEDQVFAAWRDELLSHRNAAKTLLTRRAIESWSERKNVPYWQIHTTNVTEAPPSGPLLIGTTINFEPIASIDGQGFFLEDMYLIKKDGAELLTPGVPYSAEEIEAAMK